MENKKEIITYSEMHGFVFNMGRLSINEDMLKEVLAKENLDSSDKRELIHTFYVREITKNNFLTEQTNYGNCQISFNENLSVIDNYDTQIINKLNHQVTIEEFKHATHIMEKICRMTETEISTAQNLIDEPFKKLIGLSPSKPLKI